MSNFKPIGVSIALLLFIGLIMPFFLGIFIEVEDVAVSSLVSPLISIIEFDLGFNFFDLFSINLNPFSWLLDLRYYLSDSLRYLSLLPSWMIVFILILTTLSISFTIITLARGN